MRSGSQGSGSYTQASPPVNAKNPIKPQKSYPTPSSSTSLGGVGDLVPISQRSPTH